MGHEHHYPWPSRAEVGGHSGHWHRGHQEQELDEGPQEGRVGARDPEQRRQVQEPRAEGEKQPQHQPGEAGPQAARVQDDEGRDGQVDQEARHGLGEFGVEFIFLFKELLNLSIFRPPKKQLLLIDVYHVD